MTLTARPGSVPPCRWAFRDPRSLHARHDGLVGLGGDLDVATLVHAYRNGVFPWPHDGLELPWFSPNPRGVLPLDRWRVSRSLARTMRQSGWETAVDTDPEQVIDACGAARPEGTWITQQMRAAYLELHGLGWVHSIEVWDGAVLVGGMYGVLVGGVFTGESMFHRATDASKVAVFDTVARLRDAGGGILDTQLLTAHLASLGALAIPRPLFLQLLHELRDDDVRLSTERLPAARLTQPPAGV